MCRAAVLERIFPVQGLVAALLDGTAVLGPLAGAEPEDAAESVLAGADDAARMDFDKQCLEELKNFRAGLMQRKSRDFDLGLSRLQTLVSIIRRIKPALTVQDLHRDYIRWNAFFGLFALDRSFDLKREYLRILAQTQNDAPQGLAPRRLMPLWLNICAESGGGGLHHESYLRVGLMGLRGLPLGADFDANEDFALQGLARWAAARLPGKAAFLREWHLLEGDFPHSPGFWPQRVARAIAGIEHEIAERTRFAEKTFPAAAWWRNDVEIGEGPRGVKAQFGGSVEPPPRELLEKLLQRIGDPFAALKPGLDLLIASHRRYADATGDVFYLVRTACNIGMKLLHAGMRAERSVRGDKAVELAELAIGYQPSNVFAWALYRDGLRNAGRLADAELVGWEAIRRFPEDEQWRNQLAALLAENLHRPEEAAALLRDAIALFPDDAVARNQLATLLADDLKQPDEARKVLLAAKADGASDHVTTILLANLDQGRRLRGARHAPVAAPIVPARLHLPAAEARKMLFRREAGLDQSGAFEAFLDAAAPDPYLDYAGARSGARPSPLGAAFAHAFDTAERDGSATALKLLAVRASSIERLFVETTLAVLEGRTPANDNSEDGAIRRIGAAIDLFARPHPPAKPAQIALLRDMAASFLSIAA